MEKIEIDIEIGKIGVDSFEVVGKVEKMKRVVRIE